MAFQLDEVLPWGRSSHEYARMFSLTDADLEKTIREGKEGTLMVAFNDRFSAEEIKALVAYIRKLGTPKK